MNREELDTLYITAMELYDASDYESAFRLFTQGADAGDASAMNAIGLCYRYGHFVERDKSVAIQWLKKAWRIERQSPLCVNIAVTYAGMGHRRLALYWWNKAIAANNTSAKLGLAKFLLQERNGRPTKRILALVQQAAQSEAGWYMTLAEKEEAQELLESFEEK